MKLRKLLCIAAILCLLCSVAAADRPGNFSYAVPVNIIRSSVRPYNWKLSDFSLPFRIQMSLIVALSK